MSEAVKIELKSSWEELVFNRSYQWHTAHSPVPLPAESAKEEAMKDVLAFREKQNKAA